MSKIKILVVAHKSYWMSQDSVYLPIHVGKALHPDVHLVFIGDNTGENISAKNPYYCDWDASWKTNKRRNDRKQGVVL